MRSRDTASQQSHKDSRAVSSVLGYILNFAIVLVLLASIGVIGAGFFDTTTSSVVERDIDALGNEFTGEIQRIDRLVRQSRSGGEIGQTVQAPDQIRSEEYVIEIINQSYATSGPPSGSEIAHANKCNRSCIVIASVDNEIVVISNYVSQTNVISSRVAGGDIYIYRPEGGASIQLTSATGQS